MHLRGIDIFGTVDTPLAYSSCISRPWAIMLVSWQGNFNQKTGVCHGVTWGMVDIFRGDSGILVRDSDSGFNHSASDHDDDPRA